MLKVWMEKFGVNQTHFIGAIVLVAVLLLGALVTVPFPHAEIALDGTKKIVNEPLTSVGNLLVAYGGLFQKISAYLATVFILFFVLEGVGFSVWSFIKGDRVALAITLAGLMIGLGYCVSV